MLVEFSLAEKPSQSIFCLGIAHGEAFFDFLQRGLQHGHDSGGVNPPSVCRRAVACKKDGLALKRFGRQLAKLR